MTEALSPRTVAEATTTESHFNLVPPVQRTDYSSIRGKTVLVSPTEDQYELLKKWLTERMSDCRGETIYDVGLAEDGSDNGLTPEEYAAAVATLQSLAATLDADCVELRQRKGEKGLMAQFLVRRRVDSKDFMEIRVAVVGNVDAGKSTLLGVLTYGELDNGRGQARQKLFRHKHEMETGRTSSVGNDILGFDSTGQVVNKPDHGQLDWVKICENSAKVITFIDLAGHERYLKTTVFGMTGHAPDFGMLMVGFTLTENNKSFLHRLAAIEDTLTQTLPLSLSDRRQRRNRRNDQGAPGAGPCSLRARICGCNENRHVPRECPAGYTEALVPYPEVQLLSQGPSARENARRGGVECHQLRLATVVSDLSSVQCQRTEPGSVEELSQSSHHPVAGTGESARRVPHR